MRISRSDIVLVVYPNSNLQTAKKRPALVIQADNLQTGFSQTIVAMITSNLTFDGHSSRIRISVNTRAGRQSGLRTDSIIVTDNLSTLHHSQFERVIGTWPDMPAVDRALRHTLGL